MQTSKIWLMFAAISILLIGSMKNVAAQSVTETPSLEAVNQAEDAGINSLISTYQDFEQLAQKLQAESGIPVFQVGYSIATAFSIAFVITYGYEAYKSRRIKMILDMDVKKGED